LFDEVSVQSIAAFDFDGTLTDRDTLILFLKFVFGVSLTGRAVIGAALQMAASSSAVSRQFVSMGPLQSPGVDRSTAGAVKRPHGNELTRNSTRWGQWSRQSLKEALLTQLLQGVSRSLLEEKGALFAREVVGRFIRPQAWRRFIWHRDRGDRCILVSANIDLHLVPWAKQAGFHDILTSRCATTEAGLLTGKLEGFNCRGAEKRERLERLLGPRQDFILYAYGDSSGDRELLAFADYAYYRTFGHRGES
jgi:phosphatidylglycerophosphatase C